MTIKTYKVLFSPHAETDLRNIWRHIAKFNIAAADELYDSVNTRAVSLRQFPERGAPRDELLEGLRMLVEGNYLIFYLVEEHQVEVKRVLHGAQDLTREFDKS